MPSRIARGPKVSVRFDGALLQKAREHAGLTQEELADEAGRSPSTVWRAEQGGRVSIETARDLGSALNVQFTELLSGDDEPNGGHGASVLKRANANSGDLDLTELGQLDKFANAFQRESYQITFMMREKLQTDQRLACIYDAHGFTKAMLKYQKTIELLFPGSNDLRNLATPSDSEFIRNNLEPLANEAREYHDTNNRPERVDVHVKILHQFLRNKRLKIGTLSTQPATLATIYSLIDKYQLPIYLHYGSSSGVDQMRALSMQIERDDFIITPAAAFNLTGYTELGIRDYLPSLPLYGQEQYILWRGPASRGNWEDEPSVIHAFDNSSSTEQHKCTPPCFRKAIWKFHQNFETLVLLARDQNLPNNEAINCWGALATELITTYGLKKAAPPYRFLYMLYSHKEFENETLKKIRRAFEELFLIQWNIFLLRPQDTWKYIRNRNIMEKFKRASGIIIPQ